eukprot:364547-Chlamydomonas_euryale.AAC.9
MDQTGSACSYATSATAWCRRERKAQGREKGQTTTRNGQEGSRMKGGHVQGRPETLMYRFALKPSVPGRPETLLRSILQDLPSEPESQLPGGGGGTGGVPNRKSRGGYRLWRAQVKQQPCSCSPVKRQPLLMGVDTD